MLDQTIGVWLDDLASDAPAPGGGAAAALNAAIGAALLSMVCNLTIGRPKYAQHEPVLTEALARATELRKRAVALAEADATAFAAVARAYRMPKETKEDRAARTQAIQASLVAAAEVPLQTAGVAVDIIGLAAYIVDVSNVNVLSDVAVAAGSARAALDAAAVNVEVNLAVMVDPQQRRALRADLDRHCAAIASADTVVATVRERINK